MTSQPLPPEIRRKVATLGVRIYVLEKRIEQFEHTGNAKMLRTAQAVLEAYRKQRRELRGY